MNSNFIEWQIAYTSTKDTSCLEVLCFSSGRISLVKSWSNLDHHMNIFRVFLNFAQNTNVSFIQSKVEFKKKCDFIYLKEIQK